MEEVKALNLRVIADIEGMPWRDPSIPKEQLLQSVKYFIKAYTNDVEKLFSSKVTTPKKYLFLCPKHNVKVDARIDSHSAFCPEGGGHEVDGHEIKKLRIPNIEGKKLIKEKQNA